MTATVDALSPSIGAMGKAWSVTEPLMGGTEAMRAATVLLPQWPQEEAAAYKARLETATLFPAFRRTVSVMVGKPFSKALTLGDDVPAQIVEWAEDIDREGVNLHVFCAELMGEALAHGLCGVLVEAPKQEDAGAGRVQTRAEQQRAGMRPYFVRVLHRQILGYRIASANGARSLAQLRIAEDATVADGLFGEKTVKRVRVLTPGAFEVWEKTERTTAAGAEEWSIIEAGTTGLGYIPFVPFYGWRTGYMTARPPLLDLAYLNVKHWQSQSDQDTILHVARVPILAISGADDKTSLTIGGSSAVMLPAGGEIAWVEHSGAAIKAGQESLDALEEQMIQAGAELLVKKPGARSATESANDAEGNKSDLQRITEGFEDSLDRALQMMADYASLGSGGHASLFKDFGATSLSQASGQLVLAMKDAGLISGETALAEMKRRGELAADVMFDDEQDKIVEEMPDLDNEDDIAAAMPGEVSSEDDIES
jgi:hypothetical protein